MVAVTTQASALRGLYIFVSRGQENYVPHARNWWSQAGSNRRPPACKAGALPAELWPQFLRMRAYHTDVLDKCQCFLGSAKWRLPSYL